MHSIAINIRSTDYGRHPDNLDRRRFDLRLCPYRWGLDCLPIRGVAVEMDRMLVEGWNPALGLKEQVELEFPIARRRWLVGRSSIFGGSFPIVRA